MKIYLALCLLFVLFHESQCQGTTVIISAESYFDNTVSNYNNWIGCRSSNQPYGPIQPICEELGFQTPPNSQMRWGESAGNGLSGLGFQGESNQRTAINANDFLVGKMTHFNNPVYNASQGTFLNIRFTVRDQYNQVLIGEFTHSFYLEIFETVNMEPCPFESIYECSDKISFTNPYNVNATFQLDSVTYTVRLLGFKVSNSSDSSPVSFFISEEYSDNSAFLFARIEAACPSTCENGGEYYLLDNGNCACNCTSVECPSGQVKAADCSCVCPDLDACNNGNGGQLNQDCTCSCNSCTLPKVLSASNDCSCVCPQDHCGTGTLNDTNTCSCIPLTSQSLTTHQMTTKSLTTNALTTSRVLPLTTSISARAKCAGYVFVGQGYFCSADHAGFYQCLDGPFASQSAYKLCAPGTSCKCPEGVDCGAIGHCSNI